MIQFSEAKQLNDTVINGNYCIGCGACATIKDSPFKIRMDEYGNYVAYADHSSKKRNISNVKLLNICPFSGKSKNENELGNLFFPENKNVNDKLGKYLSCYAGYIQEGNYRELGSSGGFGKWIGQVLLKENKIDYFIQVVSNTTQKSDVPLFDYKVFSQSNDVINGSKSSYYPTTLENVIKTIERVNGRYAVTGVPCFIKTLRLLQLQNEPIRQRLIYTIGIVCGGMKSANQSKMIGWQLGIHPTQLTAINFRGKAPNKPANKKIYQVWSTTNIEPVSQDATTIFGTDYGTGFFKPKACDFCDDVVAETADISIGDAWLPQYLNDSKGTSVVIIRNKELLEIFERKIVSGSIIADKITPEEVTKSQAGGFRHRREGLSYRISLKEKNNIWYPKKRITPDNYDLSKKRKQIYIMREKIMDQSHKAFLNALEHDDINKFVQEMSPFITKYKKLTQPTIFKKISFKLEIILKNLLKQQ